MTKPDICFSASATEVNINEPVVFEACCEADKYILNAGGPVSDGDERYAISAGAIPESKDYPTFKVTYTMPGTYTAKLVVSNIIDRNIETAEKSITINVFDNEGKYRVFKSFSVSGAKITTVTDSAIYVRINYEFTEEDLKGLVPEFTKHNAVQVEINGEKQQSGFSVVDFSFESPVEYTLITKDGQKTNIPVYISRIAPQTNANIAQVIIRNTNNQLLKIIDPDDSEITGEIPFGHGIENLLIQFRMEEPDYSNVKNGNGILLEKSGDIRFETTDLSEEVTYTAIAQDTSITKKYTVDIFPESPVSSFSFINVGSEKDTVNAEIIRTDDNTFNVTATVETQYADNLVASWEVTDGATVEVNGIAQESGVTVNDFSSTVIYTVTKGTDKAYLHIHLL